MSESEAERKETIIRTIQVLKNRLAIYDVMKKEGHMSTIDKFARLQCEYSLKSLELKLAGDSLEPIDFGLW